METQLICPKCGRRTSNAKYCSQCGHSLSLMPSLISIGGWFFPVIGIMLAFILIPPIGLYSFAVGFAALLLGISCHLIIIMAPIKLSKRSRVHRTVGLVTVAIASFVFGGMGILFLVIYFGFKDMPD